jgi:hypothetical protein
VKLNDGLKNNPFIVVSEFPKIFGSHHYSGYFTYGACGWSLVALAVIFIEKIPVKKLPIDCNQHLLA